MRILSTCLLSCLALLGMTVSAQPLDIFNPTFKDPTSNHDTMLDIDVRSSCVSNLLVQVHIPKSYSSEANAHFEANPFNQVITGSSKHSTSLESVRIDWDGDTILTFSQFQVGRTAGAGANPGWVNLNFDIPDSTFTQHIIPLVLVMDTDTPTAEQGKPLFINLGSSVTPHFIVLQANLPCTDAQINGDPVFAGFQGQSFQFHGLPDEHFNLMSSPDVQLNSHFVYLSSGKCDYTDTPCFTHAGTYMDALGLSVADARVKVVAGTHAAGLRVWLNDEELHRGAHMRHMTNNVTTSQLTYHHNGRLEVHTDIMRLEIVNSDMFFNIRVGLNDKELLRVGATKHTVTDHAICRANSETSNHQLVEQVVAKKYDVTTPLHGLIGQTWRNVKVCSRDWMGTVEDYVVSDLFASDSHYNYFNWAL